MRDARAVASNESWLCVGCRVNKATVVPARSPKPVSHGNEKDQNLSDFSSFFSTMNHGARKTL
jgi:hypothetical protein